MDRQLTAAVALEAAHPAGGMPPESALPMPPQDLRRRPPRRSRAAITAGVLFARCILIAVTLGVSAYGTYQMLQVVRFASMTLLQGMMIFFFSISLGWIAFSAASVLAGASKRRESIPAADPAVSTSLTALIMPIYNEDPRRTMTALQAMGEALVKIGANRGFEIVVLSDSTDADAWIRETLSVDRLRSALVGCVPVWYRRRW